MDNGGLDSSAALSSMTIGHVVSLSDELDEEGVLAPNSKALFGRELCNLLVSLDAVSPGYGEEIAYVLARNASDDIIRKVEKSLSSKRKRIVITLKAFAAA
jgi:hypothetical protein